MRLEDDTYLTIFCKGNKKILDNKLFAELIQINIVIWRGTIYIIRKKLLRLKKFFFIFCCHSATNLSGCLYSLGGEGWQIAKFAATICHLAATTCRIAGIKREEKDDYGQTAVINGKCVFYGRKRWFPVRKPLFSNSENNVFR